MLKPYPAYKPSGVDWLGDVPAHWEVHRLKALGKAIIGLTYSPQDVVDEAEGTLVLRASNIFEGRIVYRNNVFVRCPVPDRLVTQMGDILICSRSGSRALIGKSAKIDSMSSGVTFGAFMTVFRSVHNDYLYNVFNSELFEHQSGAFLTSTINQLTLGILNTFKVPWPPLPEQRAIARYLDHVDRLIQRYIDAKEKLIALLQEKRKVATVEALQSSGTANQRLKAVVELVERPVKRTNDESYTPVGLYNRGRGIFLKEQRRGDELGDSDFFWIEEGDLVISGQFAWEGAIALASDVEHGCVASHRFPLLRGKSGISDSGFLLSFFQTDWGQLILDHHSRGAAGRNRPLNVRTLLKEKISLPPIGDQARIAEMLQLEFRFRNYVRHSVQLLNEYRASLIAHVVTGKLDVRAVAEHLRSEYLEQ